MYNIDKFSENIALNLKRELNLDNDKYEVIKYGLHSFFQMAISIILTIILGGIFGIVKEALLIAFTSSILRRSSGGAHASKAMNCTIIGLLVTLIPAKIISIIDKNIIAVTVIGVIIFLFSFVLVYKLAPVDNPNKPIKSEKKIKRLKNDSITTLVFYLVLVIVACILFSINSNKIFLSYALCIYFGTAWQVFTLTKAGHKATNLVDHFLNKIFISGEEK